MKRPRTTSFVAPPPDHAQQAAPDQPAEPSWRELASVVAALIAVLEMMEVGPKAGPAVRTRRSALRSQGEAAAAIGGTDAMEAALRQVTETALERAESRQAIIREAWSGLPGWRS